MMNRILGYLPFRYTLALKDVAPPVSQELLFSISSLMQSSIREFTRILLLKMAPSTLSSVGFESYRYPFSKDDFTDDSLENYYLFLSLERRRSADMIGTESLFNLDGTN